MRRNRTRIIAALAALVAGTAAAYTLRPTGNTATLAGDTPTVQVRTQVIRRTVYVTRNLPGGSPSPRGPVATGPAGHGRRSMRTGASGARTSAPAFAGASAVTTRTSGSHSSAPTSAASHPVTTRTSGSHSTAAAPSGGSRPVTTRTSGPHASGTSGPVRTRTSGAGHGGEYGRGDGGGDN